jgi:pimeloyl-ACP methyl ester carboxylesterase
MATRILLLTGMTPNPRVFDSLLPLLPEASVVSWIEPHPHESIASYGRRMAETIEGEAPVVVCGVSFGGIVAQEIAGHLEAKACVLISSVRTSRDFPPWLRCAQWAPRRGVLPWLRTIGTLAAKWPRKIRTRSTARLSKFVGENGDWYLWAAASALEWKRPAAPPVPTVQIHGDRDGTFPVRYVRPDHILEGGGHVLTLTHGDRIAQILRDLAAFHSGPAPALAQ